MKRVSSGWRWAVAVAAMLDTRGLAVEPLSLKGYILGQQLDGCPAPTLRRTPPTDGIVACLLPSTTFASQEAKGLVVFLEGRSIVRIELYLKDPREDVDTDIVDAITSRWGPPASNTAQFRTYMWAQGTHMLSYWGADGKVILLDTKVVARRRAQQKQKAASDL